MIDQNRELLAALLEWTIAMGADTAVADEATDWLADGRGPPGSGIASTDDQPATVTVPAGTTLLQPERSDRPRSALAAHRHAPATAAPARKSAPAAPNVAVGAARVAARDAATLADLHKALAAFDGCGLKATAKNLCFYRGAAKAPVMIIGEAPGRDEDIEGRPFVGRAGQLLDRMMAAAGWTETDVHITNVVYWRPPGNRPPTPQETEICRPFLERQIELVAPRVLLLMGGTASKQILRTDEGILKIRGRWQTLEFGNLKVPVIATLHPAYLLRTPIAKRQAWRDILSVNEALKSQKI
ncbi:MAG: uracil-DNA glycosylase [Hyphomicrobium sp.]|nr:uracil-DNA glycosylase [Hyphomicrobium sp.]